MPAALSKGADGADGDADRQGADELGGFSVPDGQADDCQQPGVGVGERERQADGGQGRGGAVVEPETQQVPGCAKFPASSTRSCKGSPPTRPAAHPRGLARGLVSLAVMSPEELPIAEFAFPGPLRDQLVAAILSGSKITTTGLVADYEHEGEPLPRPGLRQAVVDSAGDRVAVIETTAVRVIRLADVDLAHALGEGEGYSSVAEWRAGHERFWHSPDMRAALDDPQFTVNDDTTVVAQTFRLLERVSNARCRGGAR